MSFRIALRRNVVYTTIIEIYFTLTAAIHIAAKGIATTTICADFCRTCDVHCGLTTFDVIRTDLERWYIVKLIGPAKTEVMEGILRIIIGVMLNNIDIIATAVNAIVDDTYRGHFTTAKDITLNVAVANNVDNCLATHNTCILHWREAIGCGFACHDITVIGRCIIGTTITATIDMAIDGWCTCCSYYRSDCTC